MSTRHHLPATARGALLAALLGGLLVAGPAGMLVGPGTRPAAAAEPTATASRQTFAEVAPDNAPGQTLYFQRVTIPPGTALVPHFHDGVQLGRVVRGTLTYEILSGAVRVVDRDGRTETVAGPRTITVRPGETLVEDASLAHTGANRSRRPVVVDVAALLASGSPLATPLGWTAGGTRIASTVELFSRETRLVDLGGGTVYGWNYLTGTGTGTDPNEPVAVEMLASVDYEAGSGPFSGFVTFSFADGARLGTRVQGVATKGADGTTRFAATLVPTGGTDRFTGATGSGVFTAVRTEGLGRPVAVTFDVTVGPR
jgi:hypothetical protein